MIPSPIDLLYRKRAFTLVEVMMAVTFSSFLILGGFNFYSVTRKVYAVTLSQQQLQDGANIILSAITGGKTEPGGIFRLSQAVSYCFGPGGSCSPSSLHQLYFIGSDGIQRGYYLNNAGTALIYHHPTAAAPLGEDETVYTVPTGAVISLNFWPPTAIDPNFKYPTGFVGITVVLTQNAVTGSASTLVNLRNHP